MKRDIDLDAPEFLAFLRADMNGPAELFPGELIVDNFAGGGGTSTGLEAAFGRPVDIAINHDPEALAMHALNHPFTLHLCEDVWDVDPIVVTGNQPVGLVWLSPDCKHFSKAKGGTPVQKKIRGLAWVTLRWVAKCKPRVVMLENVEEFQEWGPLIVDADGNSRPDPAKKGKTFQSFVWQLEQHGYEVKLSEMRACDNGAPTIRKRFFLVARRDGLAIVNPTPPSHGKPDNPLVKKGKLQPWRTAAECIDFNEPARSIFGRPKPLATNTLRRVAKGAWRHVLINPKPFIVGVGGRMGQSPERSVHTPMQTITAKADSCVAQPILAPMLVGAGGPSYSGKPAAVDQPLGTLTTENHRATATAHLAPFVADQSRPMNGTTAPADEPMRTICAQVKGGHFTLVAPTMVPLRGTTPSHLGNAHGVDEPVTTVSAGGTHHGLSAMHLTKFRTGSSGADVQDPMPTITANSFIKRPGGSVPIGIVAAHLVDMGHGEVCSTGAKRWSEGHRGAEAPLPTITAGGVGSAVTAVHLTHLTHHGDRAGTTPDHPLPTVTGAHRGEQAMVSAFFEQANGGFYEGQGRPAESPMSTITASGSNQQLVTAYFVKYYGNERDGIDMREPMHTIPTKDRFGLVELVKVPLESLATEFRERAKKCAELLHEHLPDHFPDPADMVVMLHAGCWYVLVDITLRMLKPPELYLAQGFPPGYIFNEIPDPKLLFVDGRQVKQDPRTLPRIALTLTAQVRMCGNSVSPKQAEALARWNFAHERQVERLMA
jgi:DNA (cytosine-5)-methyltransferase 1